MKIWKTVNQIMGNFILINYLTCMVPVLEPSEVQSTKAAKKKTYKLKLTYKCQWESKYSWVYCSDTKSSMFCLLCRAYDNLAGTFLGAWTLTGTMQLIIAQAAQ